ncbi:MAG: PspA/IM30 family protein [Rhizobiaceae bacterium]
MRIADIKTRTLAALETGKDDLARDAAASISMLEAEESASGTVLKQVDAERPCPRTIVEDANMRQRALQRGERLATANSRTQNLRNTGTEDTLASLNEAEETLDRLRLRQQDIDDTAAILQAIKRNGMPRAIAEKLADAGCGAPIKEAADDLLARLQK